MNIPAALEWAQPEAWGPDACQSLEAFQSQQPSALGTAVLQLLWLQALLDVWGQSLETFQSQQQQQQLAGSQAQKRRASQEAADAVRCLVDFHQPLASFVALLSALCSKRNNQ
jgi:hypothetical protein